eukprot:3933869-Rhodomonas_salina.1
MPLGDRSSVTSASQHSVGGTLSEALGIATCSHAGPNVPGRQSQKGPETTPKHWRSHAAPNSGGGQVGAILGNVDETPDSDTSERVGRTPAWDASGFESVNANATSAYAGTASSTSKTNAPDDWDHAPDALTFTSPGFMDLSGSCWSAGPELPIRPLICHCVEGPVARSAENKTQSSFSAVGRAVLSNNWKVKRAGWHRLCPDREVLHGKRATSIGPHLYPSSTLHVSEHPSLSTTLPSSHSSPQSTRPSPHW